MLGNIHSFESMAAVDGEGLRYCVFLTGCPLRCAYCHNPDTWHKGNIRLSPEDLVRKVRRYKPYFRNNGGITFSGGEPLLQADYICETLPFLKDECIQYIVDTSGSVQLWEPVKKVLRNAQSVLLDLKFWDNDSYLKYTGMSMENTLNTLDFLEKEGIKTTVRTVVVPGINDSKEVLTKYLDILKGKTCVQKYELLGFHTMGFFKYEELGIDNPLKGYESLDKSILKELQEYVNKKPLK